jgi:hypothetical protein
MDESFFVTEQRSVDIYTGFFPLNSDFRRSVMKCVTEVKRMQRQADAVERFVCGSSSRGEQVQGCTRHCICEWL